MLIKIFLVIFVFHKNVIAQPVIEGYVENVNVNVNTFSKPDHENVIWVSNSISKSDSDFIRVFIDSISNDLINKKYSFRFVDSEGVILQEVSKKSLNNKSSFWTKYLYTNKLEIQLISESKLDGFSFTVSKIGFQDEPLVFDSIYKKDQREHLLKVKKFPELLQLSKAVAKLSYEENGQLKSCTGFMVDNKHLITNEHCISNESVCSSTVAKFGYFKKDDVSVNEGIDFTCRRIVGVSYDLDVSILELELGNKEPELGFLEISPNSPKKSMKIGMIHHPVGEPQQVSKNGCKILDLSVDGRTKNIDFSHRCDTLSGSSGAPIINLRNSKVVGLHHNGFSLMGKWRSKNRALNGNHLKDFIEKTLKINHK